MPAQSREMNEGERRRVAMTVSCRDTDSLPKVDGAGEVFDLDGERVQRMHNGLLVEEGCYYGPWMTEIIRDLRGHHEPQEEVVVSAILARLAGRTPPPSQPTILEVGSFWAYYSMWFLREFPGGTAVCMEPDEAYLDVGRRNFALNGLSGTFLRGVVGPQPGEPLDFLQESDGRRHSVRQFDVASLLEECGLDHVDLLMVDIQGAETTLLERARPLLEGGRITYLVVSTHHHSISGSALTHQDARDLLRQCGATILAEHAVGESFSGDGLIAASFNPRDRDASIDVSVARAGESLFGELEYDLDRALAEVAASEAARGRAERELEALRARVVKLEEQAQAESLLRAEAESSLHSVVHSRSWSFTRPLRSFSERLTRRGERPHVQGSGRESAK